MREFPIIPFVLRTRQMISTYTQVLVLYMRRTGGIMYVVRLIKNPNYFLVYAIKMYVRRQISC